MCNFRGRDHGIYEAGITMLHYAAAAGDRNLIQALLDAGADKSASNSNGDTFKDDALGFDHPEVVSMLLA